MFGLRNAVDQEQKTETERASGFHSCETLYLNAFMLIYFLTFNTYKYSFPLFPFYSFDNDDMKSSKRHAVLLSLIFLLKCLSKSFYFLSDNVQVFFIQMSFVACLINPSDPEIRRIYSLQSSYCKRNLVKTSFVTVGNSTSV